LIAIIGNKSDMTDKLEVTTEEAHKFAKSVSAEVVKETSAKDNSGITELFEEIAKKLYKK
jgi:GTPase SAR1 family protein